MNSIILSAMAHVQNFIAAMKEERGQDLVEYAVLVGAIGVVALASFIFVFGTDLETGPFGKMATAIGDCVTFDTAGCSTPF